MRIAPYIKFASFVIGVSLAVAVADPHHRSTVARVAVFALVGIMAVALVDLARQRSPAPTPSPFEPRAGRPQPAGLPHDFERLAVEVRALQAANHGETIVAAPLRWACRRIALARIVERHPGRPDDLSDDAVAAAFGSVLWAALDGQPTTLDPDALASELEQL